MNKKICLTAVLLCCLCGCLKPGRAEFVTMVQNHRELTVETNDALVASINDDLQGEPSGTTKREALEDLRDRLQASKRQSELIEQYVNETQVDSDLIAEMIRNRWSTK